MFEPSGGTSTPSGRTAGAASTSGGGSDTELINNRAEGFTMVHGQGRVLIVDNVDNANGSILPKALRNRRIALDVVPPAGLPTTMSDLTRYDAVVLQNVPADLVTGRQQDLLARYVNDLGGGFVMVGGPQSFGAGGWTNSVIDTNILPVACEVPSQTVLPSGALVLVIDRSGSMSQPGTAGSPLTQQQLANESAWLAIETLYEQDLFGVVAFDSFSQWIVDLQPAKDLTGVRQKIMSISPGGGTNIHTGIERAFDALNADNALVNSSSVKHIILLSDGGSEGDYDPLLNQLNRAGITLSTIGVGEGQDADLLDYLAFNGGGLYHPVTDPNDLPQVFIKEARTIRQNLIKEADFTPQLVRTGSPIMTGLDATPDLGGFVLTGPKYDRRIEMPLEGPDGEPLFAHWQVGLGKAAAFTSDATNRWATPWLDWPGYGDFWARTVRYVSRPSASRDAELTASIDGDTLRVRVDLSPGEAGLTTPAPGPRQAPAPRPRRAHRRPHPHPNRPRHLRGVLSRAPDGQLHPQPLRHRPHRPKRAPLRRRRRDPPAGGRAPPLRREPAPAPRGRRDHRRPRPGPRRPRRREPLRPLAPLHHGVVPPAAVVHPALAPGVVAPRHRQPPHRLGRSRDRRLGPGAAPPYPNAPPPRPARP